MPLGRSRQVFSEHVLGVAASRMSTPQSEVRIEHQDFLPV